MTTHDNGLQDMCNEACDVRTVPEIECEEDVPFPVGMELPSHSASNPSRPLDQKLGETDDLDKEITRFRFFTGRTVLFIAMGAMAIMVLLDIFVSHSLEETSDLIENAFEAFKLITMTVLGYMFGSNSSK